MRQAASQHSSALPSRQILDLQRNTSPWLETYQSENSSILKEGPIHKLRKILAGNSGSGAAVLRAQYVWERHPTWPGRRAASVPH